MTSGVSGCLDESRSGGDGQPEPVDAEVEGEVVVRAEPGMNVAGCPGGEDPGDELGADLQGEGGARAVPGPELKCSAPGALPVSRAAGSKRWAPACRSVSRWKKTETTTARVPACMSTPFQRVSATVSRIRSGVGGQSRSASSRQALV